MARSDVLIVGAGPTGLVLALWLIKLGARPRVIDKTAEPGTTSRALAVHARTLELYRQLDLTSDVIARGHKVPTVRLSTITPSCSSFAISSRQGKAAGARLIRGDRLAPHALSFPAHLSAG